MKLLIKSVFSYGDTIYRDERWNKHRLDGPAIAGTDGYKAWWVHGKRHRLDGPAIVHTDGDKEYWVDNEHCSFKHFSLLYSCGT